MQPPCNMGGGGGGAKGERGEVEADAKGGERAEGSKKKKKMGGDVHEMEGAGEKDGERRREETRV